MIKRCAIYTRKSTEEGLDQAFNSLDAQREACENYILSQTSEGWRAINSRYDDGGLSGGNLERPALRALMQDIDDGKVDIIIVYKVDRLTRSLADFAKLVDRFDNNNVSFVSVTQQFNTTSSMGRLTLNVLLSFAQFEREVGAERVRDKIAASRKKGIWTGGSPPIGYDNVDRKLEIVEKEAIIIREIYEIFLRTHSVKEILRVTSANKWVTKPRSNGSGGNPLSRGTIYHILKNPVYAGLMKTAEKLYEGQHKNIVSRQDWDAVQEKINSEKQWSGKIKHKRSPLTGLVYWGAERLTPDQTSNTVRYYRYYVSRKNDLDTDQRIRLKASDLESAVSQTLNNWINKTDDAANQLLAESVSTDNIFIAREYLASLASTQDRLDTETSCREWAPYINKITLSDRQLEIRLDIRKLFHRVQIDGALNDYCTIETTLLLKKRGAELRLILGESEIASTPDETTIALLAKMHDWKQRWFSNPDSELKSIIREDGLAPTGYSREIRLAFLAPDIVDAFMSGSAPIELTAERLKRLKNIPADWNEQRAMLGFSDRMT